MKIGSTEISAINIGSTSITKVYKDGVLYWQTGVSIPSNPDVLFWLDGTILDVSGTKYFVDKTSHARNFLITGYDFDNTWTSGFPYKSAATISAPAGDATLIAADVNNFLYTAGTPNQIPVISFFQNIDYANRLFSKHEAQVLDGNGVETYEPRISNIVLYNAVKTGAALTACNSYYGVPVKQVANIREVGVGKTYATIAAAITAATAGDRIYVYTMNDSYGASSIAISKNITITGVGFSQISWTTANVALSCNASSITIENILLNTTSSVNHTLFSSTPATNITLNRVMANDLKELSSPTNFATENFNNCIFYNTTTVKNSDFTSPTFNTCYLSNVRYRFVAGALIALNCRLNRDITATETAVFHNSNNESDCTIKGCVATVNYGVVEMTSSTLVFSTKKTCLIQGNKVTTLAGTNCNLFNGYNNKSKYRYNVYDNVITSAQTNKNGSFFHFYNQEIDFQRNIMYSAETGIYSVMHMWDETQDNTVIPFINYSYNRNHTESVVGCVFIGTDITDHTALTDGATIIGNRMIGPLLTYPNDTHTAATHLFLIMSGKNWIITQNYFSDSWYGIVAKNSSENFTSGGIWGNIFANCTDNIHLDGIGAINVTNNTVYSNVTRTTAGFALGISDINYTQAGPTYLALNNLFKNNIIYVDGSVVAVSYGTPKFVYLNTGLDANGCKFENNDIYSVSNIVPTFANIDSLYTSIELANVDGKLLNCINTNPNIISSTQLWPITPITTNALNIGAAYNTGLDITTNWGDNTHYPVIVTKNQSGTWQIGAYIQ